ncbi:MAG: alpha/beta hydrolase [Cyanobium sp.]|nr:alpha/beta hydrolase [Cyanobium sp.]
MAKRLQLIAGLLGLTLLNATPTVQAAQNVVFVSGAFRRSIPVADLEHLALTGQPRGLLADVMRLSRQQPKELATMLNQSISLPIVMVSRLLGTRIGEAILERIARIMHPLNATGLGVPALRSGVLLGLNQGNGSLSAIGFLKAYPTDNLAVNIPALMAVMSKASSINDLVRFFSESPLDGLRGTPQAEPAKPAP